MVDVHDRKAIDATLERILSKMSTMPSGTCARFFNDTEGTGMLQTRLQAFCAMHRMDDPLERELYDIIVRHALGAESAGPGGFDLCLELTHRALRRHLMQLPWHDHFDVLDGLRVSGARRPTSGDLERTYDRFVDDPVHVGPLIKEAVSLAGFLGRIVVERTSGESASVERVSGHCFQLSNAFNVRKTVLAPDVLVIDGMVESVGEVHHLLTAYAESKRPLVLFVRAMSDEVLTTMRVNHDRGMLSVVPVIVKFDIEQLNTLNDLAVVCGTDVVSSTKGETISGLRLEDVRSVDRVILERDRTIIINRRSAHAVAVHVDELRRRRNERIDVAGDLGELYDLRLRTLMSDHVIVRIPYGMDVVVVTQAIDNVLRTVKALTNNGVAEFEGRVESAQALVGAIRMAQRCVRTIVDLGCVLVNPTLSKPSV